MGISFSDPQVTVNNDPVAIVPNSFEYEPGYGETNTRAASNGGGNVTPVHSVNAESKISTVKFKLYVTDENERFVDLWKLNIGNNVIVASTKTSKPRTFTKMALINTPNFPASSDGEVELEFKGAPLPTASGA